MAVAHVEISKIYIFTSFTLYLFHLNLYKVQIKTCNQKKYNKWK